MGGNPGRCSVPALTLGLLLALVPALSAQAGPGPDKPDAKARPSRSVPTTEPGPPLSLGVRLVNLQKNSTGGVATLALTLSADVSLEDVTLSLRQLPADVTLSDGSRSRTWSDLGVGPGGTLDIPIDLLVGRDGKFVISAEATGAYKGKTLRRGSAYKLLVGVQEKTPQPKDGAIEFPGVPGGGGR